MSKQLPAPELKDGELICKCGSTSFCYVEDISCARTVNGIEGSTLSVDGLYTTEGFDDGDNPRLQCSSCCREYSLPADLGLDFV